MLDVSLWLPATEPTTDLPKSNDGLISEGTVQALMQECCDDYASRRDPNEDLEPQELEAMDGTSEQRPQQTIRCTVEATREVYVQPETQRRSQTFRITFSDGDTNREEDANNAMVDRQSSERKIDRSVALQLLEDFKTRAEEILRVVFR
eukprot:CAMPEP_0171312170 /NCGR_PEP_ID=MMETSP0816-20121228/22487_1 /TAXON_ID=420281 /ORGANISM="Proboscia inermis, Strain CCAP1064/1" /LENGTH=148 /DNA_ID=CAMNT_0011797439 /DNA_START=61 /DNA_END=507 /DNA_ORIENTATION=-